MSAHRPAVTPRRCLLPEDGGCGEVQPWREYYMREGAFYGLCARCRNGVSEMDRVGALYEGGAPAAELARALHVYRTDSIYPIAKAAGWSAEKRQLTILRRKMESPTCVRSGCTEPRLPDSPRCELHERRRQGVRASHQRRRVREQEEHAANPGKLPNRYSSKIGFLGRQVHQIRCHLCGVHRWTTLDAPCPACGGSGAQPVTVWDEMMEDIADEVAA